MFLVAKYNLIKVVVRAEILPRDFRQTLGKYYLPLTIAKFKVLKNFTIKRSRQFLKALTVKLSIYFQPRDFDKS